MLKPIGSLHNVPVPSAAVLGESLKLLATFGDKRSISPLLEEVREVQANNEQVFREAQALSGVLAVMRKELEDSRKAFSTTKAEAESDINLRLQEISQAEARLSGKVAKFAEEQGANISKLDDIQVALTDRTQALIERESKCKEKERDLGGRLSVLESKESVLRLKEQQLQAKENKLRSLLDGG